jgi:Methylase of chemotaxis methyl-accepting proteins
MNSANIEPYETRGNSIELTDSEFIQLTDYIRKNYGISISGQKREMLNARLSNTLIQSGYKSYAEFISKLNLDKNSEAVTTLVNKITTNHTFFMREKEHFYYFRDVVLPFLEKTVKDNDLRIWCAACSTGEESYTLAIILSEFFGNHNLYWDIKILATDISERALGEATAGVYSADRLSVIPLEWKNSYFNSIGHGNYKINEKIKNNVIYRKFNLMEGHYPFKKKFHVIFCRNVMIYFNNDTKVWLINRFYDILEPGGYLFIGHSEFIAKNETELKYIMPAVYRKI